MNGKGFRVRSGGKYYPPTSELSHDFLVCGQLGVCAGQGAALAVPWGLQGGPPQADPPFGGCSVSVITDVNIPS